MSIDLVDAIGADAFLEERNEEEFQERMEDISRVANECIKKSPMPGSMEGRIYLCSDPESKEPKGEWHGNWSAAGEIDTRGKKSLTFEVKENYKSQEKIVSGGISGGVDEKGKLSGRLKVEGEF